MCGRSAGLRSEFHQPQIVSHPRVSYNCDILQTRSSVGNFDQQFIIAKSTTQPAIFHRSNKPRLSSISVQKNMN